MVKTTLMKVKDEERIFVDLVDVLNDVTDIQDQVDSPEEFGNAFFATKKMLKELLAETIRELDKVQPAELKEEKKDESAA